MININFEIGKTFMGKNFASIKQRLAYSNLEINPYMWLGININLTVVITLCVALIVYFLTQNTFLIFLSIFLTIIAYWLTVSTILSVLSDQRAKFVEQTLPDALLLMASNLRSGMPTDEAIILSSRPEFGFLAKKIDAAGKMVATGATFEEALETIPKDVDSFILRKTVNLIIEGLQSGGEIATLLEETAADIRDNEILQKEINSIILIYAIFIFIAAIITAPILYSISTHLAGALSRLSTAISTAFLTKNSPTIKIVPSEISPDFLLVFSVANLITTAIFGSLMIALITKGNEKYGIKYIPIFITISLVIFLVVRYLLSGFFSSIRI